MGKFYTKAITAKGRVVGYGVYDSVNGMESQHSVWMAPKDGPVEVCLFLANEDRDDRNSGIAVEATDKPNHFRLNLAGRTAIKAARAAS